MLSYTEENLNKMPPDLRADSVFSIKISVLRDAVNALNSLNNPAGPKPPNNPDGPNEIAAYPGGADGVNAERQALMDEIDDLRLARNTNDYTLIDPGFPAKEFTALATNVANLNLATAKDAALHQAIATAKTYVDTFAKA